MTTFKPCGPTASAIINGMRNKRLGWAKAIGELIDNAVGNGATNIEVTFKPHRVDVIDDGVGCTEEMFAALVSLGYHVEDDAIENAVSLYGVGAKDAFIWCGGPTQVYSRRDDVFRYLEVDWDAFGQAWDYDDPTVGEFAERKWSAISQQGHGVGIVIPHHDRQMNDNVFADLTKQLTGLFWAAVETGVHIGVWYMPTLRTIKPRGGILQGKPMPELVADTAIDASVSLADGRPIRIVGGIVQPSVRTSRPGFEYIYGHRVIVSAGGLGAGGMDFERCYFRVFLLGDKTDWRVTTNKTGLHDADEAALGQAVFDYCKATLQQSQSEDLSHMADQDLLDEVSELLTAANRKHAKRSSPTSGSGTVKSTGTGGEHTKAAKCHDRSGKYSTRGGSTGRIAIKRSEFEPNEEHLAGKAVVRDRIVRVNTLHPFIRSALETRDKVGLFVVAMSIWSDAWTRSDDNGQMRHIPRSDFVEKLSAMLKTDDNMVGTLSESQSKTA